MSFGEYQDLEYSPISTIATVLLTLMASISVIFNLSKILSSRVCSLVLLQLAICYTSTFLYGNPDMQIEKQIVFITFWEAVFLLFYLLTYNDIDTINDSKRFFCLLTIPVVVLILMSNILRGAMAYDVSKMGNHMIFYLLTLLPWLMILEKRVIRLACVLFVLVMSVIALKRSAMVVSIVCALIFMYREFMKGNESKLNAFLLSAIMIVSTAGLLLISNNISEGNAIERVESLEEDEGSGRIERYKEVLSLLRDEDDGGKLVFGHGYRTVEIMLGESSSAHNDFLEVLYDYGIIGLIIYALIHLCLIKRVVYLNRSESPYAEGYIMSYVVFFTMSMVSHLIIYPTYFIILTSYWGSIEGHLITIDENER